TLLSPKLLDRLTRRERRAISLWKPLAQSQDHESSRVCTPRCCIHVPTGSVKPAPQGMNLCAELRAQRSFRVVLGNAVQEVTRLLQPPSIDLKRSKEKTATGPEGHVAQLVRGLDAGC